MTKEPKTTTESEPIPESPIYTDSEVGRIISTQQLIYALDDAISSQSRLERPPGFIQPLSDLRAVYANELKRLTSKVIPNSEIKEQALNQ